MLNTDDFILWLLKGNPPYKVCGFYTFVRELYSLLISAYGAMGGSITKLVIKQIYPTPIVFYILLSLKFKITLRNPVLQ